MWSAVAKGEVTAKEASACVDAGWRPAPSKDAATLGDYLKPPAKRRAKKSEKRQAALAEGIKLFNTEPAKGIQWMVANSLLRNQPRAICAFLLHAQGIEKHAIGQYLGMEGDAEQVLQAYVETLDFTDKKFDECLRLFFQRFHPCGEAAIMYRMTSCFGSSYHRQNPRVLPKEDQACLLAYATLMLNTDLHSASILVKMTKEQFMRNIHATEETVDPSFLAEIYDRVAAQEIKTIEESADAPWVDDWDFIEDCFEGDFETLSADSDFEDECS